MQFCKCFADFGNYYNAAFVCRVFKRSHQTTPPIRRVSSLNVMRKKIKIFVNVRMFHDKQTYLTRHDSLGYRPFRSFFTSA